MAEEIKKTDPTITESNPLTLHHFDHLGLVLVSKLLDGDNYGQWSHAMRIALSAKNKISFINETVKMPPQIDAKFLIWERCKYMVLS